MIVLRSQNVMPGPDTTWARRARGVMTPSPAQLAAERQRRSAAAQVGTQPPSAVASPSPAVQSPAASATPGAIALRARALQDRFWRAGLALTATRAVGLVQLDRPAAPHDVAAVAQLLITEAHAAGDHLMTPVDAVAAARRSGF